MAMPFRAGIEPLSGTRDAAPAGDELEDLWKSYYSAIFNPARLNAQAMRSEMPVRYWQNLPGVDILRPRAVDEVVLGERGLTAYAGTRRLVTRGDTLNHPLVTITLDSPAEGVLGVTIEGHRGGVDPGPAFAVADARPDVVVAGPTAEDPRASDDGGGWRVRLPGDPEVVDA